MDIDNNGRRKKLIGEHQLRRLSISCFFKSNVNKC